MPGSTTRRRRNGVAALTVCAVIACVGVPGSARAAQHDPGVPQLQRRLADANASLKKTAAKANDALEAAQLAAFDHTQAAADLAAKQAELAAARGQVAARGDVIAEYAASAYRSGSQPALGQFALLFGSQPERLIRRAETLNRVSAHQRETLRRAAVEVRQQQLAAAAAALAAKRARQTAMDSAKARSVADRLVLEQQRSVVAIAGRLQDAQQAASLRRQRLAQAERASRLGRRAEEQRGGVDTHSGGSGGGGAICSGSSAGGYRNGRLPARALCPLWGAQGHRLRSDASAAFRGLSQAYAAEFGRSMCVTDSYRSYFEQVDVARRKPDLAARPGTSKHGWGLAVDLCGGVQSAGSPTHDWLRSNAGRFRFFHPSWARGNGGPFEPWHWEFAG